MNFYRTFCKQTVETLIRYRVLLGLIWFCTVYLCPTKRTLGICGLIALYEKNDFFLTTLDCLVSYGPRCEKNCFRGWGGGGVSTKSVSNQSSAKETSLKIEISPAASLHMILSKKQKKRR